MTLVARHRDPRGITEDPSWQRLARGQSPIADAVWIESFAAAFVPAAGRTIVHELRRGEELIAALPIVRSGRVARAWTSLDNEHSPYWLISGALDEDAAAALLEQLLADADYVFLRRVPLESQACTAITSAATRMGLPISLIETAGSGDARVRLTGTWGEFRATLPKHFQRDLPRQQRLLEKQGVSSYARHVTPGPELDAALRESFDLETHGWKGTHGSPIKRAPDTLAFYSSLANGLASQGRFALYLLRLDGRIIAFEYSLRGGGHVDLLKLSFDPAFARHSPGQVLRMLLLEDEIGRGEVHSYHLGRPSDWKSRWATEVAPLCTLRVYARTLRGRAAYLSGPALKARLKAVPVAMAVRNQLTSLRKRFLARRR